MGELVGEGKKNIILWLRKIFVPFLIWAHFIEELTHKWKRLLIWIQRKMEEKKKNDRVKVDFDALHTTQTQFFLLLNLFIDGNENFFHFYDELYHLQSSWELQRIPFYPKNPQLWIERSEEGWRESSFKFQYKYSLIISWQKIMSLRVWMMKMKSVIENIINVHKLTIKFTDEMMSNRCMLQYQ